MIKIKLNNTDIIEIDSKLLKNILPIDDDSIPDDTIIPLNNEKIKAKTLISFNKNYKKNFNDLPIQKIISYINIALILQLYKLLDILQGTIILTFTNEYTITTLKPYRKRIVRDISKIENGPAQDIQQKLIYFKLDYELYEVDILNASPNLSYIVVNRNSDVGGSSLYFNKNNHSIFIFKNGLYCKKITNKSFNEDSSFGISDRKKLRFLDGSCHLIKIARDCSKYSKLSCDTGVLSIFKIRGDHIISIRNRYHVDISVNMKYFIVIDYIDDPWTPEYGYKNKHDGIHSCHGSLEVESYYIYDVENLIKIKIKNLIPQSYHFKWSIDEEYLMAYNKYLINIIKVSTGEIVSKSKGNSSIKYNYLYPGTTGIFIINKFREVAFIPFIINNKYIDLFMCESTTIYRSPDNYNNSNNRMLFHTNEMLIFVGSNDSILICDNDKILVYRKVNESTLSKTIDKILN